MCRPYTSNAAATPAMTATGSGTPAASSSEAAPAPARMPFTAAIMLALVKNISGMPALMPSLATAPAATCSRGAKNAAAAGSSVA